MHSEIRAIIIEDDEYWSKIISATLHSFGYTVMGTAANFEAGVSLLNTLEYDIVLLDIGLNNKNSGIELGKMINTFYHKPFAYITGNADNHSLSEVLGTHPSAYLIKPIHPSSLIAAIQNAIHIYNNRAQPTVAPPIANANLFFVKQGDKYKKIDWTEVAYLYSDKKYTIVFNSVDSTEYYIRSALSNTLNFIVPPHLKSSFLQVNRAEAVHIPFILEIRGDEIRTAFKTLTLTESFSSNFKKTLRVIM